MENIDLIRKIVWSFHHTTGHNWDDLFQEASLAYLESMKTFNPRRGKQVKHTEKRIRMNVKRTTHAWICITNHLKNYLKLEAHQNGHINYLEEFEKLPVPNVENSNFLDSLTKEAQVVANVVLRTSRKFCVLTTEEAEERIERVMLNQGWPIEKIHHGIDDLKYACCEE
jgi:hypothetical protein